MHRLLASALLATSLCPAIAFAQDTANGPNYNGIRLEADAGGDRYKSQGISNTQFGYGGTGGFDGTVGEKFVIGAEASYWHPNHYSTHCTSPAAGTTKCDQEGRELGAAVRAGFLVTPAVLVFAKGGYVNATQTGSFVATTGYYYINGNLVPGYSSYTRIHTDGYQVGGGAQYSLSRNIYVSAQYVYSRYDNHTRRDHFMGGIGVRF